MALAKECKFLMNNKTYSRCYSAVLFYDLYTGHVTTYMASHFIYMYSQFVLAFYVHIDFFLRICQHVDLHANFKV